MQKTSVKGKKYIFKAKGLIETLGGIHKKMPHCWRLYYRRILENFLVCHPKFGEVHAKKVTTEKHRFATSKN